MNDNISMRSVSKDERITHSVCVGGPMTLHTYNGVIRRVRPIVLTDDDPAAWVISKISRRTCVHRAGRSYDIVKPPNPFLFFLLSLPATGYSS